MKKLIIISLVQILFLGTAFTEELLCPVGEVEDKTFVADVCAVPEKYVLQKDKEKNENHVKQNRAVKNALKEFLDVHYRDSIKHAEAELQDKLKDADDQLNRREIAVTFAPKDKKIRGLKEALAHYERLGENEDYLLGCLKIDRKVMDKNPDRYKQRIENSKNAALKRKGETELRIARLEGLDLKKHIQDKKKELADLESRLDAMVEKIVDEKCRSVDILKWVKHQASFSKSPATRKGAGKILSSHRTREEAEASRDELLELNPEMFNCRIAEVKVPVTVSTTQDDGQVMSVARPAHEEILETSKFAGEVFKNNSKELSQAGNGALDDMIKSMGLDKLNLNDSASIEGVTIYSCASMYRNCGTSASADKDNSCATLSLMRNHSDNELRTMLEENGKLSPQVKQELKMIFSNDVYSKKYAAMAADPEQAPLLNEMRMWLAISTLRGESTKTALLGRMKEKGINLDPSKVNVDPTGRPNDPFNNGENIQGGLGLSGTCGPLPKNDQFYGKYCHMPAKSCSPLSSICHKLKEYYGRPDVKSMLSETLVQSEAKDEYGVHRYFSANVAWKVSSPEVLKPDDEMVNGSDNESNEVTRYEVGCYKVSFACSKDPLIEVHIEIPKGNGGNTPGPRGGKGNKKLGCPTSVY